MQYDISKMTADQLVTLKARIDFELLGAVIREATGPRPNGGERKPKPAREVAAKAVKTRKSSLKGSKVPPKYRDPKTGVTWSGRGRRPSWVKESHLIAKTA